MPDRPRVLVTAALGHVGREVVRACESLGLAVRVSHPSLPPLAARWPGRDAAVLDFLEPRGWPAALDGVDRVFLLRPPAIADMARTLVPFVDAARRAGVAHGAFLSVIGADRMRWVPHAKVEAHLRAGGAGWTVLRPGFFAQNLEDAYRRDVVEDDRLYVPAGDGRVAFVDVRDVGEVAARALAAPEAWRDRALELTGPEALRFDEVAALLSAALGRPIRYEAASLAGYAGHLRRRGLPWAQVAVQTVLHAGLRRGDAQRVTGTVTEVLGRGATPLGDYVARSAGIWRRSPA